MKRLALIFLLLPLQALALPKPDGLKISGSEISWSSVEGASLYRVAVWSAPNEDGKRSLVSAVWVKSTSWAYGDSAAVIPKAGKLPSTKTPALKSGSEYRLWVASANASGLEKSEWAKQDFTFASSSAVSPDPLDDAGARHAAPMDLSLTATPSMSPTAGAAESLSTTSWGTPTPTPNPKGGAELEMDVADNFKETPEGGVKPSPTPAGSPSLAAAKALLAAGKGDDAEAAYKKILDDDATNADAWEGLGDSYDQRKMKIEAKECYEKALKLDKKREHLEKWLLDNVRH